MAASAPRRIAPPRALLWTLLFPLLLAPALSRAQAAPGASRAPAPPTPAEAYRAQALSEWRTGRILYGVGTAADLLGSGLVLGGILTGALYDEGVGSALALSGTGAHTVGFILSAAGLGLQHNAIEDLGAGTGRGLFGVGTAFGVAGLLGTGAGLFFAATRDSRYVADHDTAALACAASGAVLYVVSGILYYIDAGRVNAAWKRLGRF